MNKLTPNPILEFNPNQMIEVRKTFGYGEINRLLQDIKLMEDWIKMQLHFMVKVYDNAYLERYLMSNKGSIERAKKRLDKLCTLRGLMPEYLQRFDVETEFNNHLKVSHLCALPKPTPDNLRILYYSVHDPDAAAFFDHLQLTRYLLVIIEYLYCHDYNAGFQIIADTRNLTFGIVTKVNPIVLANGFMLMTEAFGLRLAGIHFISGSKVIDTLVNLVKQALSKKLTARLHVHENFEALYKAIPKNLLPKDIGGDLSSVAEISANNFKEFSSPEFIKKLQYIEGSATDESKRLSLKFNEDYSGMPGSFKALRVD